MKINEIIIEAKAVKQRLDPKCWKGKHKEGTKIKGGVRVNNCVPNESVAEGKITLSTDPSYYGAIGLENYKATGPVVNIPANQLVGFEPDAKMNQPKSKANVEKIVAGLKQGNKLPPLLVRKYNNGYQVIDGHHRFWAYKLLGVKSIPAQVVPESDIEEKSKQGVAEGAMKDVYASNQDAVYAALTRRVIGTEAGHLLIQNYGLDQVMDAMREVADFHGDVEEIGSSDVSAYMRQLQRTLESNK